MSYNKITDPISGKKVELDSSKGKRILLNYLKLQTGGVYYDKYLGKMDRPLFGAYGLWGKYWDFITKNIHAYRTTPKGKKIDMRRTKINFRNLFDNNLDEAIYMVKVFSRVELDQLLNTPGHMRKARRFISRLFTILNGYKYVNEDFSKDIETSGLLEAYEIYQDILN